MLLESRAQMREQAARGGLAEIEDMLEAVGAAEIGVGHFTAALLETSRIMKDNPGQWIDAVLAARDDLKRPRVEAIATFIGNQWCVDGCMDPANLGTVVAALYANPDFKDVKVIPATDIFDASFAQKANEMLGPYTPKAK